MSEDCLVHWAIRGLGGCLRMMEAMQRDGVRYTSRDLNDLGCAERILQDLQARALGRDVPPRPGRPEYL